MFCSINSIDREQDWFPSTSTYINIFSTSSTTLQRLYSKIPDRILKRTRHMPELSEYHPNDPKNPDRAKFLSRRRNSQFSRSDDPYHDLRGSIPHDVRHNQQNSYPQQFTRQYSTRPRNPPAASSSYVHQRRSSPERFYSQSKDYNSTVPQEHYSSEYTRPLSSFQRVGSHNESSSKKSTRCPPAAPQEHHTSRRPLRN